MPGSSALAALGGPFYAKNKLKGFMYIQHENCQRKCYDLNSCILFFLFISYIYINLKLFSFILIGIHQFNMLILLLVGSLKGPPQLHFFFLQK